MVSLIFIHSDVLKTALTGYSPLVLRSALTALSTFCLGFVPPTHSTSLQNYRTSLRARGHPPSTRHAVHCSQKFCDTALSCIHYTTETTQLVYIGSSLAKFLFHCSIFYHLSCRRSLRSSALTSAHSSSVVHRTPHLTMHLALTGTAGRRRWPGEHTCMRRRAPLRRRPQRRAASRGPMRASSL